MKKTTKRFLTVITVLLFVMLSGCGPASYSMTGTSNKTTVEVNAEDGKYGEAFVMDISKNQVVTIESQLEKGQLQVDFFEVVNMRTDVDDPDDYEILSTIKTVTVGPGDNLTIPLDYVGDFMPAMTAIGQTTGKIVISVVKQ